MGPQGAEAIVFWTVFPDADNALPCTRLLHPPVGPSAADLAAAVATAPGTELVTGPSDVTVGGRAAKRVALRVWIVDVDGTRLFIEAETTKQAGPDLEREIQQIVGSIRFD